MSRVLLEKLIVARLVRTFSCPYGSRKFITVFKRVCHWFLFWANSVHSTDSHLLQNLL